MSARVEDVAAPMGLDAQEPETVWVWSYGDDYLSDWGEDRSAVLPVALSAAGIVRYARRLFGKWHSGSGHKVEAGVPVCIGFDDARETARDAGVSAVIILGDEGEEIRRFYVC